MTVALRLQFYKLKKYSDEGERNTGLCRSKFITSAEQATPYLLQRN
jgi:hypothetical protein